MGVFKLKRGYDIKLAGEAEQRIEKASKTTSVAVQPIDFRGLRPGMKVEAGDTVKRGSILFVDKQRPEILFRSPAAGTVREIVRGERRAIQRVIIDVEADQAETFTSYDLKSIEAFDGEQAKTVLLDSGFWPALVQRPFGRIADPAAQPKAIFISAVNTAPLQPAFELLLKGREKEFTAGLALLGKLCAGALHLSHTAANREFFQQFSSCELHEFEGPHPAGNVGVQIHHIDRLLAGQIAWTISPVHVAQIGALLLSGEYQARKIVALTGSELLERYYSTSVEGAAIADLVTSPLADDKQRVISGDVLDGSQAGSKGYVGFYDDMICVIPEVPGRRFFGWLQLGLKANSFWRIFLSKLTPSKKLSPTTDMNGEERAFVATGEYEKVLPMDVLPSHLCKAILVEDIELMEQLGIYEVAPEDVALCSYICPSKIEFGEIIEKGITIMEKEG